MMDSSSPREKALLVIALLMATSVAVYGANRYTAVMRENADLENSASTLQGVSNRLEAQLENSESDNENLNHTLQAAENQNAGFASAIGDISNTVNQLQKVSQTDPQLLQKYSRVYFLNENYVPASLSSVDARYLYDPSHPQLILSGVLPFLDSMIAAAGRDGVTLQIISAYRSFYEQSTLKTEYKMTYGSGANQFSADQGYSEHQLGTAVDFGAPDVKNTFMDFASSTAYAWLTKNAYQFGFVISYPKENAYYQFEPWHWRFVGVSLATYIHNSNEFFYNLSQRQIDTYLGSLFD